MGTGSNSNPGRIIIKIKKLINKKGVEKKKRKDQATLNTTQTSTHSSTTAQSTQQSIKTSGLGSPNRRPRIVLADGISIDIKKTDYYSTKCQIRTWGAKCTRKADLLFKPLIKQTEKFRNIPICNYHHFMIRKNDEKDETDIEKLPTFTKASDLI